MKNYDAREIAKVIDKYERAYENRIAKLEAFDAGLQPWLVSVVGSSTFYKNCHTVDESLNANLADFEKSLDIASDTLPFLEPWFGTGAYAEAFGCEYVWREGECPATRYAYKTLDEVRDLEKPRIKDGKIFTMVLDAIELFRTCTKGRLPMIMTDTQSAHDTATLILDAAEVFVASYSEPESLAKFLGIINELIADFSQAQIDAIGDSIARPGHIMSCTRTNGWGISISDDNLAVASPDVNSRFLLPYDEELGERFGGLAIHSCGNWGHTMPLVAGLKNIRMIDCALTKQADPNPNIPEVIRDNFRGSGITVQVRVGSDAEAALSQLERIWVPDLKLIVMLSGMEGQAERQYSLVNDFLMRKYGGDV